MRRAQDKKHRCSYCHKFSSDSSTALHKHVTHAPQCFAKMMQEVHEELDKGGPSSDPPASSLDPSLPADQPPLPFANHAAPPSPQHLPQSPKSPKAYVEEEHEEPNTRWVEEYYAEAQAGASLGKCRTEFEERASTAKALGRTPWYPFESREDWEIGSWLLTAGLSRKEVDNFLALRAVRKK